MKDEKASKYSIIIIPKTEKVIKFTIPSWLPKAVFSTLIAISIFIFFTFNKKNNINSNLEQDNLAQGEQINELQTKIQELKNINDEKDSIVKELQERNIKLDSKAEEIEIRLQQIAKLREQLENLSNNR